MKRSYTPLALALLLSLAPSPVLAESGGEPVLIAALVHDDLDLYFDEAELTMVESATRAPKPITQVAENITVITAQEIEQWNAHTLQEVLVRVPGVMVAFAGQDVANHATLLIQGSDYEHVQVFVDGMRWNDISSDFNLTNQIPVGIIDRVEVIKGPASSTWGSAFGGVVNVITKGAGTSARPTGTVTASYGERQTRSGAAEAAGLAGPVGYYLHAGHLDSDGQRDDRWFDGDDLYAKFSLPLPAATTLTLSLSQANPNFQFFRNEQYGVGFQWEETVRYATATLSRPLGHSLHLALYGSLLDKGFNDYQYLLASEAAYKDLTQDQSSRSGAVRVYGDLGRHAISLGAETYRNSYVEKEAVMPLQGQDVLEETWSLYMNDTIRLGRATLTPGLRYDAISIADSQLSPSLGLTYRVNDTNLLRAAVARGFRRPVPMLKTPDPIFVAAGLYVTSPNLESETVQSYQLGVESTAVPALLLKATLFHHDADHAWRYDPSGVELFINDGAATRYGVELALETERWQGVALMANYTYVDTRFESDRPDPGETWVANLILDYQGPWGVSGRLAGNYTWWDTATIGPSSHQDTVIWDLTATRPIEVGARTRLDLFATARNLFNGSQYTVDYYPNAGRWLEAGLRLHF